MGEYKAPYTRDKITSVVGENMEVLRDRFRVSRSAASTLLGVTPATLYKYETGRARQPSHVLWELTYAAGVPVGTLFAGLTGVSTTPDKLPALPESHVIAALFEQMPPSMQAQFMAMAQDAVSALETSHATPDKDPVEWMLADDALRR